jgi:hypothetical protein
MLTTDRLNDPMRRKVWPDDYETPGDDHGVRCPKCNCPRTTVDYTRHSIGQRNQRRRICGNCGHDFQTYEKAAGKIGPHSLGGPGGVGFQQNRP